MEVYGIPRDKLKMMWMARFCISLLSNFCLQTIVSVGTLLLQTMETVAGDSSDVTIWRYHQPAGTPWQVTMLRRSTTDPLNMRMDMSILVRRYNVPGQVNGVFQCSVLICLTTSMTWDESENHFAVVNGVYVQLVVVGNSWDSKYWLLTQCVRQWWSCWFVTKLCHKYRMSRTCSLVMRTSWRTVLNAEDRSA